MKKILLIFLLLMQTSCASLRVSRKHQGIHPKIKPYVEEAISISNGKLTKEDFKNVTIGFRDYGDNVSTVGTCWPMPWLTEIDINQVWWEYNHSPIVRFELILHEIGHCILKRNHTTPHYTTSTLTQWVENLMFKVGIIKEKDRLYDGCPASIMHPYTLDYICLMRHYDYYVKELFTENSYKDFVNNNPLYYIFRSCRVPRVINHTNTWTKRDKWTLKRSKKRCIELYNSCLKVFIKKEETAYNVICE